jgi:uncharacterized coiled-coil DUF342 family protein
MREALRSRERRKAMRENLKKIREPIVNEGHGVLATLLDYLDECFDEIDELENHVASLRKQIEGIGKL